MNQDINQNINQSNIATPSIISFDDTTSNCSWDSYSSLKDLPSENNSHNLLSSNSYLKLHKNITFSYFDETGTFQRGPLGDSDTYLLGILHLNYTTPRPIRSVILQLRGIEKTSWCKSQARSKSNFSGEHVIIDKAFRIYSGEDAREIKDLDIPFKIKLPRNLPETMTTDYGFVKYILRATVNRHGVMAGPHIAEFECPLKKTLLIDPTTVPSYQLREKSHGTIEYSMIFPPMKKLNIGAYVTIPLQIRFLQLGLNLERVEVQLLKFMEFRSNNPNESRHSKETIASLIIPRHELRYLQPVLVNHNDRECVSTICLFIPRGSQPSFSAKFINISYQLQIKLCLFGTAMDLLIEEDVHLANIIEAQMSLRKKKSTSNVPPLSPVRENFEKSQFHTGIIQSNGNNMQMDSEILDTQLMHKTSYSTFVSSNSDGSNEPRTPPHEQSTSFTLLEPPLKRTPSTSSNYHIEKVELYPTALSPPPYHRKTSSLNFLKNQRTIQKQKFNND